MDEVHLDKGMKKLKKVNGEAGSLYKRFFKCRVSI